MEFEASLAAGPHALLARLVGKYEGRARLWMQPGDPQDDEPLAGEIVALGDGRWMRHTYTTRIAGNEESGQALMGCKLDESIWQLAWVDTWHTGSEIMVQKGSASDPSSALDATTPYADGTWHWRTTYMPTADGLLVRHYNSGPGIDEVLAVEWAYTRA